MNLARTPLGRKAQSYRIADDLSLAMVPLFAASMTSRQIVWELFGQHLIRADAHLLRRIGRHFMVLARVRSAVALDEESESRPAE